MLRVIISPDNQENDWLHETGFFPKGTHSTLYSFNKFRNTHQIGPCEPQLKQAMCSEESISCEYLEIGTQVGFDKHCSNASDAMSNEKPLAEESRAGDTQEDHWPIYFPSFGSEKSVTLHELRGRSRSYSPHQPIACDKENVIPNKQSGGENITPGDCSSGLIHPIPRPGLYMATSRFTPFEESRKLSETLSSLDVGKSSLEGYNSDGDRPVFQGSDWTSSDLGYPPLFQSRASPDASSATTLTDTCPGIGNTSNSIISSTWATFIPQTSWETQRQDSDQLENIRVEARYFPSLNQQYENVYGDVDQFPPRNDDVSSFRWLSNCDSSYTHHSFPPGICKLAAPEVALEHEQPVVGMDPNLFQYSDDVFAPHKNLHPERTVRPHFEGNNNHAEHLGHESITTPYPSDTRNAFLIECKRRGLSYKDIKRIGGFKEAESTLRGRFRTLTKAKEHRVRKPQWQENDIKLLCEGVNACSELGASGCRPRGSVQPPKVSWKKVAQYIWAHGGSYHFGNATCKKKWCEVQNRKS